MKLGTRQQEFLKNAKELEKLKLSQEQWYKEMKKRMVMDIPNVYKYRVRLQKLGYLESRSPWIVKKYTVDSN